MSDDLPRTVGTLPDGSEVLMSQEFTLWLNRVINGLGEGTLRNVVAGNRSILNGTAILPDIQIEGRGSVNAEQNAQATNIAAAAAAAANAGGGMSVSISPTTAYKRDDDNDGTITTNSVSATVSGGTGALTYSWAIDESDLDIDSASASSTTFSGTVPQGSSISGTATVTVTDSTPGTPLTATDSVPVSLIRFNGGLNG